MDVSGTYCNHFTIPVNQTLTPDAVNIQRAWVSDFSIKLDKINFKFLNDKILFLILISSSAPFCNEKY